jgi:ABC-2 type transport system permease protein
MLTTILRHEWRNLTADLTAWVVLAVFAVAAGCAIANGYLLTQKRQKAMALIIQEEEDLRGRFRKLAQETEQQIAKGQLEEVFPPKFPGARHSFYASWNVKPNALLPPPPLSVLAIGQSEVYSSAYSIYTQSKPIEETQNPLALLLGHFDLVFVLLYIYPLFIIALSFNLVAAERESGTLSLLLSQPIRLRTLILGKVTVRALLVFGSAGLFCTGAYLLNRWVGRTESLTGRVILWMLAVIAYGAFWFGLSVVVNSLRKSAAASALILVVCWISWVVFIPSLVNFIATVLYPVPSRLEFVNAEREINDAMNRITPLSAEPEIARRRTQMLDEFFAAHPEFAPYSRYTTDGGKIRILYAARNEEMMRRMQPIREQFERPLAAQEGLINYCRFFSPAMLLQSVLGDLAGTGASRHSDFLRQIGEFQHRWEAFFWPRLFENAIFYSWNYDHIPRFQYQEEPYNDVARRIVVPLALLALFPLLLTFCVLRVYRRYSPVG